MWLCYIWYSYSDDIIRAVKKLKVLGPGFSMISLKSTQDTSDILIRSIPGELTADHTKVLKAAETQSFTSVKALK